MGVVSTVINMAQTNKGDTLHFNKLKPDVNISILQLKWGGAILPSSLVCLMAMSCSREHDGIIDFSVSV